MALGLVEFIDKYLKKNEHNKPWGLFDHQRAIFRLAFDGLRDEAMEDGVRVPGKLPWDTVVYSCVKKSGKTTLNAALVLAWAFTQEPPNEVYILANNMDQAAGRVYSTAIRMLKNNPDLLSSVAGGERGIKADQFELVTGTIVRALPSEATSAAGSNHGLVSFDELWAYKGARAQLLWAELTPVPTRRNSIRLVTTYAGFTGEGLLWDLYTKGVGPEEYEHGKGKKIHPDLPIYLNEEAGLFVYWDREARMPWQTEAYYRKQRAAATRPSDFLRYHRNQWAVSNESFIQAEQWDACTDASVSRVPADPALSVVVGIDAATKHDCAAVIGVTWDHDLKKVRVVNHGVWYPEPDGPGIDLEATIEATVLDWRRRYNVSAVIYDPTQMATIAKHLRDAGLHIVEYPQTPERLTAIGDAMWELLDGRNLVTYHDDILRQHALNAVAVATPRGWRIAKEKASQKIDLFVALAMAAYQALEDSGGLPDRDLSDLAFLGSARTASTIQDVPAVDWGVGTPKEWDW